MRELCTNYGEISGFWWDMNVEKHVDPSINAMIRQLQPKAVINDRGFDEGDFGTPERDYDAGGDEVPVFTPADRGLPVGRRRELGLPQGENYYTDRHLMRSIDKYLARDANYLLNVGPAGRRHDPAGVGRHPAADRRRGTARSASRSRARPRRPRSRPTATCSLTRRGNTLYVHLHRTRSSDAVKLTPIARRPDGPRC